MALAVIEERRIVFIADSVQRHCTVEVWVCAADDMTRGDINHNIGLVCEDRFERIVLEHDGGPPSKENTNLNEKIRFSFDATRILVYHALGEAKPSR